MDQPMPASQPVRKPAPRNAATGAVMTECKIARRGFRGEDAPPAKVIAAAERVIARHVENGATSILARLRPTAYLAQDRASYLLDLYGVGKPTIADPYGQIHDLIFIDEEREPTG
jgi:hypothetical protein